MKRRRAERSRRRWSSPCEGDARQSNQRIVKEKDPVLLWQHACKMLVETRGYRGAWIALGEASAPAAIVATAGWGSDIEPFLASLREGQWPGCLADATASGDGVAFRIPEQSCSACPLANAYPQLSAGSAVLRFGDRVMGLLGVSIPGDLTIDESERSLLEEVAGDIAFALQDIETERLRKERFSIITQSSADAIFITDQQGKYSYVNEAACQLLGYSADELTASTIMDISLPAL